MLRKEADNQYYPQLDKHDRHGVTNIHSFDITYPLVTNTYLVEDNKPNQCPSKLQKLHVETTVQMSLQCGLKGEMQPNGLLTRIDPEELKLASQARTCSLSYHKDGFNCFTDA